MAAGAPLGSTLTIVLADGPCEMGEMAPRGETCPVSASWWRRSLSPSLTCYLSSSTYYSMRQRQ